MAAQLGRDEDEELQRAIAASMDPSKSHRVTCGSNHSSHVDEQAELELAIAASLEEPAWWGMGQGPMYVQDGASPSWSCGGASGSSSRATSSAWPHGECALSGESPGSSTVTGGKAVMVQRRECSETASRASRQTCDASGALSMSEHVSAGHAASRSAACCSSAAGGSSDVAGTGAAEASGWALVLSEPELAHLRAMRTFVAPPGKESVEQT